MTSGWKIKLIFLPNPGVSDIILNNRKIYYSYVRAIIIQKLSIGFIDYTYNYHLIQRFTVNTHWFECKINQRLNVIQLYLKDVIKNLWKMSLILRSIKGSNISNIWVFSPKFTFRDRIDVILIKESKNWFIDQAQLTWSQFDYHLYR